MVLENNIPEGLKQFNNWVCYTTDKIPVDPKTGRQAKSNDALTWSSYDVAIQYYNSCKNSVAGVGFQFTGTPFTGIDIDKCVDQNGISPAAMEIIQSVGSYTEFSPSGTGIHVILEAKKTGKRCSTKFGPGKIEVYSEARYFTITGKTIEGYKSIEKRQAELESLYLKTFGKDKPTDQTEGTNTPTLDVASEGQRRFGDKFSRLWNGDWTGYESQSCADLAMMDWLAKLTNNNTSEMERLFLQSGLGVRDKARRKDYLARTIERAINTHSTPHTSTSPASPVESSATAPTPSITFDLNVKSKLFNVVDNLGTSVRGIATGFARTLDLGFQGFGPGDLVLFAGRPGQLKTVMLVNLLNELAINQKLTCLFYTLEMPAEQILQRLVIHRTGATLQQILGDEPEVKKKLAKAMQEISAARIGLFDDKTAFWEIVATSEAVHKQTPVDAIFCDYVQLVKGGKSEARYVEVGNVTQALKRLAMRLKCPVIAAAQLARRSEDRERPRLSDLRESGSLEQDADCVFLQHVPEGEDGKLFVNLDKNRHGATNQWVLYPTKATYTISDGSGISNEF